jgi:mannose-6-phosphate isomerase-like protein (cupin superfamily)
VEQEEKERKRQEGIGAGVEANHSPAGASRIGKEHVLIETVSLVEKFALFREYWSPKIVGELNGQYIKLAKLKGEFVWHHHEAEDEMFYVVKGNLTMRLPEEEIIIPEGEFLIVPRGVEHCPVADEEVQVLLFEPKSTAHTGNVRSEMTVEKMDWI